MNKFKTISTLATTLIFAAIVSKSASAQVITVTRSFTPSMCQPFNSEAAENLTFFDHDNLQANNFGGTVQCPIPSDNSLFSSVTVEVRVAGPSTGIRPSCTVRSFKPNSFGEVLDEKPATLNSTRSILTAIVSRAGDGYQVLSCNLPSGTKIFNYSISSQTVIK